LAAGYTYIKTSNEKKKPKTIDLSKQEIKTKPIRVKCPKCAHTQLSVIGIKKDSPYAIPYKSFCAKCGTATEFLEHLLPVKKKRRRKENIPPPLFDDNDKPIRYE